MCRLAPMIYFHLISATRRGGQCATNIGSCFNCAVTVTHCGKTSALAFPSEGGAKGAPIQCGNIPVSPVLSGREAAIAVSVDADNRH